VREIATLRILSGMVKLLDRTGLHVEVDFANLSKILAKILTMIHSSNEVQHE